MKLFRKVLTVLSAAVFVISSVAFAASADDANITYTGNSGELIFEPGSEYSPTDLFANFKDVMPGATLTQRITVHNKADNTKKVKIYLRSLGSTDEKYNEFLDQLTLTVKKAAETPMFDAAADETAGLTDWVCLGTLYSDASVDLEVTLKVPETLDNMFQKQIGMIRWQFVAEEFPLDDPTWVCPGDPDHEWHIEERDGKSTFVCDDCDETERVKCMVCGEDMHEAIIVTIGGNTYVAYPAGYLIYGTKDGRVFFYLNEDGIIEYYTVDGVRTDVRDVHEYTLYQYYECYNEAGHHTDPHSPQTGDDSHLGLILLVMTASAAAFIILFIRKRRKNDGEEVTDGVTAQDGH